MDLGISLHALTQFDDDRRSFDESLRLARAAGAAHVMLLSRPGGPTVEPARACPATLIDLPESCLEEVLWRVATAGLWIGCLYCGGIDVANDQAAERALPTLRTHAALAVRLGVGILVHNAGRAPEPGLSTADKTGLIERLAGLAEAVTGEYGIRTAADLHIGAAIETVDDVRYYQAAARDPRVGVVLNIGHLTTGQQPGWELLEDRNSRIPLIAWKDHLYPPPSPSQPVVSVELGQGNSPFHRYIAALVQRTEKPLALISFENIPFDQKPAAAARSVDYLRAIWQRGGLA